MHLALLHSLQSLAKFRQRIAQPLTYDGNNSTGLASSDLSQGFKAGHELHEDFALNTSWNVIQSQGDSILRSGDKIYRHTQLAKGLENPRKKARFTPHIHILDAQQNL